MKITEASIPAVKIITPIKHGDHRGFFSETYRKESFRQAGIDLEFVQDNHSYSVEAGTIRGLHLQLAPFAQDKLVRVVRGAVLDIAVDVRAGSPTFGRHVAVVLSAANWNQLLVPIGFAHGLCTLEPETEVIYKVTNYYSAAHERGVLWNDPALAIDWPVAADKAIVSDKDRHAPRLAEIADTFVF